MSENKQKLLVVDDDAGLLDLMKTMLEQDGFFVHAADNGLSALKLVEQNTYDAALIDLYLPDMKGTYILEEIKKRRPEIPVILISGMEMGEEAMKAMELGAVDYVIKPVDFKYLISLIRDNIAK